MTYIAITNYSHPDNSDSYAYGKIKFKNDQAISAHFDDSLQKVLIKNLDNQSVGQTLFSTDNTFETLQNSPRCNLHLFITPEQFLQDHPELLI